MRSPSFFFKFIIAVMIVVGLSITSTRIISNFLSLVSSRKVWMIILVILSLSITVQSSIDDYVSHVTFLGNAIDMNTTTGAVWTAYGGAELSETGLIVNGLNEIAYYAPNTAYRSYNETNRITWALTINFIDHTQRIIPLNSYGGADLRYGVHNEWYLPFSSGAEPFSTTMDETNSSYTYIYRYNGSYLEVFRNNVSMGTRAYSGTLPDKSSQWQIGDTAGTSPNVIISNFWLFDRALTNSEIGEITNWTNAVISGSPNITSWGNDKTNNQNVTIIINTSENINVNATANQTVNWNWFIDGTNQSMSFDNFTSSFATTGTRTIQVNGSNVNGSDLQNWTIHVVTSNSVGNNYFVSINGSNSSDGLTPETAWQNISYATQQAVAGDTIFVLNGTWINENIIFSNSGNATHPITLTAYNGTPIIAGTNLTTVGTGIMTNQGVDYININGLLIFNYTLPISIQGNYTNISNNEISHFYGTGIVIYSTRNTKNNTIYYNTIHDNDHKDSGNSIQLGSDTANLYWFTNATVIGNNIYNNTKHGLIDVMGRNNYTVITKNILHDQVQNASQVIFTHYGPMYYATISDNIAYNAGGIYWTKFRETLVSNNTVYNCQPFVYAFFSETGDATTGSYNITIQNNSAWNCPVLMEVRLDQNDWTDTLISNNMSSYNLKSGTYILRDQNSSLLGVLNNANVTIEYTLNNVFSLTNGGGGGSYSITTPTYYPTKSNATARSLDVADHYINIIKYPMTVLPSQNSLLVTNTSSVLTLDYQTYSIPRVNITFGSPIPAMNITLNNVTTGANYSLYYDNDTYITSVIAASPVYFNLSLPNDGYYITEASQGATINVNPSVAVGVAAMGIAVSIAVYTMYRRRGRPPMMFIPGFL